MAQRKKGPRKRSTLASHDAWDAAEADGGDESDEDGDDSIVPCPFCGREIFEDSPRCPFCETYLSDEDQGPRRHPVWVSVTAVICLGVAIWWVLAAW